MSCVIPPPRTLTRPGQIEGRWVGREQIGSGVGRNLDDSITFLKTSEPIWTAAGTSAGIMSVLARREGEKLEGHKVFLFSIRLPETVECAAGETYGVPSFPLPATFAEPGARAGVFYTIGAVVHRGKLSTSDAWVYRALEKMAPLLTILQDPSTF
jgi:hypothetical protein